MKLAGELVTLFLGDDGRRMLTDADILLIGDEHPAFTVEESEDLGLWLRIPRVDGMHLLLLRWEYILGIDLAAETAKGLGLGV